MSRMGEHASEHDTSRDAEDCAFYHQIEKERDRRRAGAVLSNWLDSLAAGAANEKELTNGYYSD